MKLIYGQRKLKRALLRRETPMTASRRKIGRIMDKYGLISKYVRRRKRAKKDKVNEENKPNLVERQFDKRKRLEVVVSDLTYVMVGNR